MGNLFLYLVFPEKTAHYDFRVALLIDIVLSCIAGALVCKAGPAVTNQPAFYTNIYFCIIQYALDTFLVW